MQIISDYQSINKQKWTDFLFNHPHGNIFQSPEMYKVYENSPNYRPVVLCGINEENEIIAILLAAIIKEKSGIMAFLSSRAIISGGPIFECQNPENKDQLLKAYKEFVGRKIVYTQIRNFTDTSTEKYLFEKNGFVFEDHLNIILDLSIGIQEVFNHYSRSRKKGVNRGKKAGFVFESTHHHEFIDIFYELVAQSYNRIKHPFPSKSHFLAVCKNLDKENYRFFGLKYEDSYIATLLGLIYNNKFYGYYMGLTTKIELLKLKPSDLFFHNIFNWCIENDVKIFDWLGAGKPGKKYGVRDFKRQFGGEVVNFGRYQLIHKPIIYKLGKLGLLLWKKIKI